MTEELRDWRVSSSEYYRLQHLRSIMKFIVQEIDKDYAIIAGQRVDRPSNISRSTWLDFWESCVRVFRFS